MLPILPKWTERTLWTWRSNQRWTLSPCNATWTRSARQALISDAQDVLADKHSFDLADLRPSLLRTTLGTTSLALRFTSGVLHFTTIVTHNASNEYRHGCECYSQRHKDYPSCSGHQSFALTGSGKRATWRSTMAYSQRRLNTSDANTATE